MFVQAGGHQLIKTDTDNTYNANTVYKPTKKKELKFYKKHLNTYPELKPFLPTYYKGGRIEQLKHMVSTEEFDTIINKRYSRYVQVENVSFSKLKFIIDIKLGSIHWKSSASKNNVKECLCRNIDSIMSKYLFRLDGFVENVPINNNNNDSCGDCGDSDNNDNIEYKEIRYSKEECRLMSIDDIKQILGRLTLEDITYVCEFIDKLRIVLDKAPFNLYGPSILIVKSFDGQLNIKLIDFTTYERLDKSNNSSKQSKLSKNVDKVDEKVDKKLHKTMRKALIKTELLNNMHYNILLSLDSLRSTIIV